MKKELENIIQALEELKKTYLSKKYINDIKNGVELPTEEIEDMEIYYNVRQVYKKGLIDELKKVQESKCVEYKDLISSGLTELQTQLGTEFTNQCIQNIETGKIKNAQKDLYETKEKIKIKTIKSEEDCLNYEEMVTFMKAKKRAPLKTKLFGVKVEVLEKTNKDNPRRKMGIPKVDIIQPSNNSKLHFGIEEKEQEND